MASSSPLAPAASHDLPPALSQPLPAPIPVHIPHYNVPPYLGRLPQATGQSYQFDPLYIEDPLTPGNNVGRNCFRIFQVQRSFSQVHAHLEAQLRRSEATGIELPLLECLFD